MATPILTDLSQLIDQAVQPSTLVKSFNLVGVHHLGNDTLCLVRDLGTRELYSVLASKLLIYSYGNETFLLGAAELEDCHHV